MRAGKRRLTGGRAAALAAGVLLILGTGCTVQNRKNGQAENVRLRTPIGSLDVRTNADHGPDVGLPVYPGAVEAGRHGNDSGSADIHMSFGSWHLNVKAIEYRSGDGEDRIISYYRSAMAQYGDVLTCKDKAAVGEPVKTSQGLTCANDHEYDVSMRPESSQKGAGLQTAGMTGEIKLLAGSPEKQRIVEFTPDSGGTKFSIVEVELPHRPQTD